MRKKFRMESRGWTVVRSATPTPPPPPPPGESPHLAEGAGHGRVHLNADEGVVSVRREVGVVGGGGVGDDQVGLPLLLALRLLVPLLLGRREEERFSGTINHLMGAGTSASSWSDTCTARQPNNHEPDCGETWEGSDPQRMASNDPPPPTQDNHHPLLTFRAKSSYLRGVCTSSTNNCTFSAYFSLFLLRSLTLLLSSCCLFSSCRWRTVGRGNLSPPFPPALPRSPERKKPQKKPQLTFLLQLVVVQQQADHLLGLERVGFEVASGDHHPLDLVTGGQKASIYSLINSHLQ